jgi:hypothetical protein
MKIAIDERDFATGLDLKPKVPNITGVTPSELATTVAMRNVPNDYTRAMLLDLLDKQGFSGLYDFLYLPIDFERQSINCGFSIINFVNPGVAQRFRAHFSEFSGWSVQCDKVCEVTWSEKLQGLDAHIEVYRNSPILHKMVPEKCKPMLFRDGQPIVFPAPTKRIRAPRKGRCIRAPQHCTVAATEAGSEPEAGAEAEPAAEPHYQ